MSLHLPLSSLDHQISTIWTYLMPQLASYSIKWKQSVIIVVISLGLGLREPAHLRAVSGLFLGLGDVRSTRRSWYCDMRWELRRINLQSQQLGRLLLLILRLLLLLISWCSSSVFSACLLSWLFVNPQDKFHTWKRRVLRFNSTETLPPKHSPFLWSLHLHPFPPFSPSVLSLCPILPVAKWIRRWWWSGGGEYRERERGYLKVDLLRHDHRFVNLFDDSSSSARNSTSSGIFHHRHHHHKHHERN